MLPRRRSHLSVWRCPGSPVHTDDSMCALTLPYPASNQNQPTPKPQASSQLPHCPVLSVGLRFAFSKMMSKHVQLCFYDIIIIIIISAVVVAQHRLCLNLLRFQSTARHINPQCSPQSPGLRKALESEQRLDKQRGWNQRSLQ